MKSQLFLRSLGEMLVNSMSKSRHAIDVARRNVITGHPDENLPTVAKKMVDHWISSVLVVENDKPIGIVTDGIIFRLIAQGRNPLDLVASDVMVSPVHTIHVNTTLGEAEDAFLESKVHRLVIVNDEGKLVGIVSKKDVDRFVVYSLAERMVHHRHTLD